MSSVVAEQLAGSLPANTAIQPAPESTDDLLAPALEPSGDAPAEASATVANPASAGGGALPQGTLVLRMRGLPFTATEHDVRQFFDGYELAEGAGALVVVTQGFHRGEAYVRFLNAEDVVAAHRCLNNERMGSRYIELYASTPAALELQYKSQLQILSEKRFYVRLRGLPFQASDGNVLEFFAPLGPQAVMSVHLCRLPGGRPNGTGFVELASEELVRRALATLQRGTLGTRYVELFESSLQERDAAMAAERRRRRVPPQGPNSASGNAHVLGGGQQLDANVDAPPFHPVGRGGNTPVVPNGGRYGTGAPPTAMHHQQHGESVANGGFEPPGRPSYPCIRVRGLPYTANESTIAEFLVGVHIPPQGVHMVYNSQERPTGEAFVEVVCEADVQAALALDRQAIGRRYIEVFRSSQAEMMRLQVGEAPMPYGAGQMGGDAAYPPMMANTSSSAGYPPPRTNYGGYYHPSVVGGPSTYQHAAPSPYPPQQQHQQQWTGGPKQSSGFAPAPPTYHQQGGYYASPSSKGHSGVTSA